MSDCGWREKCHLCGCEHFAPDGVRHTKSHYDGCKHGCTGTPCHEPTEHGICASYFGHSDTSEHVTEGEWFDKVQAFNKANYDRWGRPRQQSTPQPKTHISFEIPIPCDNQGWRFHGAEGIEKP